MREARRGGDLWWRRAKLGRRRRELALIGLDNIAHPRPRPIICTKSRYANPQSVHVHVYPS